MELREGGVNQSVDNVWKVVSQFGTLSLSDTALFETPRFGWGLRFISLGLRGLAEGWGAVFQFCVARHPGSVTARHSGGFAASCRR